MAFLTGPVLCSLGFAASAAVAVAAHALGRRSLVYVFKPLSTALLLLLVASGGFASGPSPFSSPYAVAILSGLFFSLLGDIFLMLPSDHFRSGLTSFLLAHACYLFAFVKDSPLAVPLLPWILYFAAGCCLLPALWTGIPCYVVRPMTRNSGSRCTDGDRTGRGRREGFARFEGDGGQRVR